MRPMEDVSTASGRRQSEAGSHLVQSSALSQGRLEVVSLWDSAWLSCVGRGLVCIMISPICKIVEG